MPPAELEPVISAGYRRQSHALDRSATGIGKSKVKPVLNKALGHCGVLGELTHSSVFSVSSLGGGKW
jgi:hypothetical protein